MDLPVSDAWQRASDADADLNLDYDSLNPHFDYIDEDNNQRHVVWFLDAVTLLNEMRAARQLGLQTFALVAARVGRQLAVERVGQAQQPCVARCSWRWLNRDIAWTRRVRATSCASPVCRSAGKRTVQMDYGRARCAQEAHDRRAYGCVSADVHDFVLRIPSKPGCAFV